MPGTEQNLATLASQQILTQSHFPALSGTDMNCQLNSGGLARDLLVPIVHDTTYEALREISPLLGSRSGLSTAEEPMADVAAKIAELVAP